MRSFAFSLSPLEALEWSEWKSAHGQDRYRNNHFHQTLRLSCAGSRLWWLRLQEVIFTEAILQSCKSIEIYTDRRWLGWIPDRFSEYRTLENGWGRKSEEVTCSTEKFVSVPAYRQSGWTKVGSGPASSLFQKEMFIVDTINIFLCCTDAIRALLHWFCVGITSVGEGQIFRVKRKLRNSDRKLNGRWYQGGYVKPSSNSVLFRKNLPYLTTLLT